jgi:hypothetical protein
MKRILFLMHERSGSTFLSSILIGKVGDWENKFSGSPMQKWLETVPEKQCYLYLGSPDKNVLTDLIRLRPNINRNEAYRWESPATLEKSFYDNLPGTDWKFVYLLRDPRNKISSLTKRAFGQYSLSSKEKRLSFVRNQARISALELQSVQKIMDDPRFMLLRFEDLVGDSLNTVIKLFDFIGFEIDVDFYKKIIDDQQDWINSSFSKKKVSPYPSWSYLSKTERRVFNEMCGKELLSFGYEKNHDWVKEPLRKIKKVNPNSKKKVIKASSKSKKGTKR